MAQKKRMGYGGLVVGVSVVAMFWVTDMLDIGGRSAETPVDSLALAPVDGRSCAGLRDAAKGVMQARQAGGERAVVADVLTPLGKDGEVMLALAYGYPVRDTPMDKEQAVVEFTDGIHAKCLGVVLP
ncbi:MAG: hypothetical protein JKX92_13790 [Porticoccaceae bacterium]|nr:hypothetical protein [Porticoccaceae bacterium]OUS06373.1 hypothetical protein A9Q90_05890 [Gammaproteobacteria bacterium 54_18_T64]